MTKQKLTFSDTLRMARIFVGLNPARLAITLTCLLTAGLAEGLGVATLLPVLGIATGQAADNTLSRGINDALGLVGLSPSLGILLSIVVVGILAKAALTLAAQRNVGYAAADLATELRLDVVRNLMLARWSHFITQPSGRISNALAYETNVSAAAYNALANLLATSIQVVVFSLLALMSSWQVTLTGLLAGGLMIALLHGLVGRARAAGGQQAKLMNLLLSRMADGLQLIKPLKSMGQEGRLVPLLEDDARAINKTQRQMLTATSALSVFQEPVFAVFLAAGLFLALTYTSYSLADMLFMAILFQRIVVRTGGLQIQYQKMVGQEAAFWSLRHLLDAAAAEREILNPGGLTPTLRDGVTLRDVRFAYDGHNPVLDGVSLEIAANRLTAIHGPSGTGKTTLVDLVIGLMAPQEGSVAVDGVPIAQLDQHAWRQSIGYVPQELILLHDTIAANVTLGDPALSEDAIREALVAAGAWDFVAALPDGIHTMAGERGARFSGGQRQRISLARALVRKPALLILDEPTTALDPATEQAVCATLRDLARTTTILAISHQHTLVAAADVVYRMDGGRALAERGV